MNNSVTTSHQFTTDELDVIRAMLYLLPQKMPHTITWTGSAQVQMDVLARRIGLIPYAVTTDQEVPMRCENTTSQYRLISAGQTSSTHAECLTPDQIIVDLPPGVELNWNVRFAQGRGVDNARYDLLHKIFTAETISLSHPYRSISELLSQLKQIVSADVQNIFSR